MVFFALQHRLETYQFQHVPVVMLLYVNLNIGQRVLPVALGYLLYVSILPVVVVLMSVIVVLILHLNQSIAHLL